MILCDTNILIEFLNGNQAITDAMNAIGEGEIAISAITIGELYFGAHDKRELRKIQNHLASLQQIQVDEEISRIHLDLLGDYALNHRLNIPDALIAATAIRHALPLYTLNVKDFRFIPGLQLYTP